VDLPLPVTSWDQHRERGPNMGTNHITKNLTGCSTNSFEMPYLHVATSDVSSTSKLGTVS